MALGRLLANIVDEEQTKYPPEGRLSSYYLDWGTRRRGLQSHYFTENHPVFSPELQQDVKRLFDFIKSSKKNDAQEMLSIRSGIIRYKGKFYATMDKSGGKYKYAKSHIRSLSELEHLTAIEKFKNERSSMISHGIDVKIEVDEWLANYCYAKDKLPAHFIALRNLTWLAEIGAANKPIIDRDKASLKYSEPQLAQLDTYNSQAVSVACPVEEGIGLRIYDHDLEPEDFLPQENAGASFSENAKTPLVPLCQNILVTKHHQKACEQLCLRSPFADLTPLQFERQDPAVSMTMLIDYFEDHLGELSKQEARILFATTMSKFSKNWWQHHKSISLEYLTFFDTAIKFFENQLYSNVDKSGSREALLFLLDQKQRLLRQAGIRMVNEVDVLEQTRGQIRELLSSKECQGNEDQQFLNLMLLDSYSGNTLLTETQIVEVTKARATIERLLEKGDKSSRLFPQLYDSAARTPSLHAQEIMQCLTDKPQVVQQICTDILHVAGIELASDNWKTDSFPLCSLQLADGSLFQIDLLTGKIIKNGHNLLPMNDLYHTPLYKTLFGSKKLIGTEQPDYIECQEAQGPIRFFISKNCYGAIILKHIQRQFDGEWHQYIPAKNDYFPLLPPLTNVKQLQVWQKVEAKKPEYLLYDSSKQAIPYRLDSDGYFWFADASTLQPQPRRYAWCNISKTEAGQGVKGFDPDAILWQPAPSEKEESYPPLLQFPHYSDNQGKGLQFVWQKNEKEKEEHWHLQAAPHLILSENQSIEGIKGIARFLVIENASGERELLLPWLPLKNLKAGGGLEACCHRIPLKKGVPETKNREQNAYLAYLSLMHATTPQDYATALNYLKKAFSFGRYEGQQWQVLGWILNITQDKPDHSVGMDAVRLYAAWLVHDNLKRNPLPSDQKLAPTKPIEEVPTPTAPPATWEAYWQSGLVDKELDKLIPHYLARRSKAQYSVKLENVLDAQELIDWGLDRRAEANRQKQLSTYKFAEEPPAHISDISLLIGNKNESAIDYYTRPGYQLSNGFYRLYLQAKSSDPKDQNKVERMLGGMTYDPHPNNRGLKIILQAALEVGKDVDDPSAKQLVSFVDKIYHSPPRANTIGYYGDERKISRQKLNILIEAYANQHPKLSSRPAKKSESIPFADVVPKHSPRVLPIELPANPDLHYKGISDLQPLHDLHSQYFLQREQIRDTSSGISFEYKSDNEFTNNSIAALNEDTRLGSNENATIPLHSLKDDSSQARIDLKSNLKAMHEEVSDELKKKELLIEQALKPPKNLKARLHEEAKLYSGQKAPLTRRDLLALFTQGDKAEFRRLTHLESDEEIEELYQAIGDSLLLSRKADHINKLLVNLEKLETLITEKAAKSDIDVLIQKIGSDISLEHYFNSEKDPAAFLVLEEGLGLYMKEIQVKGLRKMQPKDLSKKFPSIFQQLIQGGGKTLIFGHTLALMKAAGYHLSIHVPATAQYGTSLYDMQHISGKVFGQKERTLEFDDDPKRFSFGYLSWMKETMLKAVNEREYINMTNETLRAMRCKYIKTRLIIKGKLQAANGVETEEIKELEKCNSVLKEMLKIMRKRAVFTFDEVHLATAPNKELNMPYGDCTHVSTPQAKLISRILQLAANAQIEGRRLLRLLENQQSQQNDVDYQAMVKIVVTDLLKVGLWQENLMDLKGSLTQDESEEIRKYLLGELHDIPSFIRQVVENPELSDKEKQQLKSHADVIVLAKQMLAKGWLKDRLSKSVSEHHGFSSKEEEGKYRVAIPFIANTKAAEGSEFSDRFVMMTNTLMSYIVEGLSSAQTIDLIDDFRKKAYLEVKALSEEDPNASLRDTSYAKQFKEVCGKDLFFIDTQDKQEISDIQAALLAGSKESIDMLLDYVIAHELTKVEIYENQVCSHGQNTPAMAQSAIGYSGSQDNPNMAPVGTTLKPEKGTNGQTIDLLIRENDDVWVINPYAKEVEIDSLFTDLIAKHPEKDQIRAIIDVGCHFRGVTNEDVAKMTCKYLHQQNSPIEGVLYFDPKTDGLLFRPKSLSDDQPGISITDTRPETIKAETGFSPEKLFTYYDQDHITGIDIGQASDTRAVITWSEHVKLFEGLQGGRRLRELDFGQRLISAIEPGAIGKVNAKLRRPPPSALKIGKMQQSVTGKENDPNLLNIKDLILFSHLNFVDGQPEENLQFCLQKIETVLQQYILDAAYDGDTTKERDLFDTAEHLFKKSIAVDLYTEYALARKNQKMSEYLKSLQARLMLPLKGMIDEATENALNDQISAIIADALKGLPNEIEVSTSASETAPSQTNQNRESTQVQFRQQVEKKAAQTENRQEVQAQRNTLTDDERDALKTQSTAAEIPLKQEQLESPTFAIDTQKYDGNNLCLRRFYVPEIEDSNDEERYSEQISANKLNKDAQAEVWNLNQLLTEIKSPYKDLFDNNIQISSNFATSWANRVDILGNFRKHSFQWLLIYDEDNQWKLQFISIEDAINLEKMMGSLNLPYGRRMAIVRPKVNLKVLASAGEGNAIDEAELTKNPQAMKLISQAMLFSGKTNQLSHKKWYQALDMSLSEEKKVREDFANFAIDTIFHGSKDDYMTSPIRKGILTHERSGGMP